MAGRNSLSALFVGKRSHVVWRDGRGRVAQTQRRKHFWSFSLRVLTCYFYVFLFFAGDLLTVRHRPTARQKHYGTTVPLQRVGRDWKPIGQLQSQVENSSWQRFLSHIFFFFFFLLCLLFSNIRLFIQLWSRYPDVTDLVLKFMIPLQMTPLGFRLALHNRCSTIGFINLDGPFLCI